MDAVASVGPALLNLVQEDDFVSPFPHRHVQIPGPSKTVRQVGELMVMGGEQAPGTQSVVDMLTDRPGNGHAVEGGGAAADFIKENQGSVGGMAENAGGFHHLDHESRGSAGNIIGGSEACEDPVHWSDAG